MLESGAKQRSWPDGFDVLSREGGLRLVIHDADALILFANAPHLSTDGLLDVWQGARPSAATHGAHAELQREVDPGADLFLTVAPPRTWLDDVAPAEEAALSPLRFLKAAALSVRNQELYAVVDCHGSSFGVARGSPSDPTSEPNAPASDDAAGCQQLASFLAELKNGLLTDEPKPDPSVHEAWTADTRQPLRFRARWPLPEDARNRLFSRLLLP